MFTSVFGISNESKPLFGDSFIFFVLIYDRQLKVKWAHQKKVYIYFDIVMKTHIDLHQRVERKRNKMKKNCMNISMWLCKHLKLNRLEKQSKWESSSNFNNFCFNASNVLFPPIGVSIQKNKIDDCEFVCHSWVVVIDRIEIQHQLIQRETDLFLLWPSKWPSNWPLLNTPKCKSL